MINLNPTFTSEDHRYSDDAGNVYPSVTTVIERWWPVDTRWFNQAAAQRGTEIHAQTAAMDKLGMSVEDAMAINPDHALYLRAWHAFCENNLHEWYWIEQRFVCEVLEYAGTVDRVAKLQDGKIAILDIKSGAPAPYHELQIGAYGVAAKMAGLDVSVGATVHVNDKGGHQVKWYNLQRGMEAWKALLKWANYRRGMG